MPRPDGTTMNSLIDMLNAIENDKPRAVYCTQNDEDCASCSLSSYGRDCRGHAYATGDQDSD